MPKQTMSDISTLFGIPEGDPSLIRDTGFTAVDRDKTSIFTIIDPDKKETGYFIDMTSTYDRKLVDSEGQTLGYFKVETHLFIFDNEHNKTKYFITSVLFPSILRAPE